MANLLNVKLQEIHEGKRDYLRYKGRDGRYHFLDTKEMPDSDTNSVTYGQLVEMRQAALLEPGMLYRITDYATTTVQENTRSAGNQFDIVVMALDSKTLAERAWAMPHDGDEYFKNSKLEAWQLWYSLDNDTDRFAWADPENGKGVIYRMIDEWGNDCPYDFKNMQFKRWAITALTTGSEDMKAALIYDADDNPFCFGAKDVYNGDAISGATFSTEISEFYFTFNAVDEGVNKDYSLGDWGVDDENGKAGAYLNVISPFYRDVNGEIGSAPIVLNNVVFINAFDGDYWYNCSLNKFGGNCQTLTFGSSCWQNTFGNNCGRNTFGNNNYDNTFGNNCNFNTFGNNCQSNTFGNSCGSNTFGNGCYNNTFGNNCYNNTFGNDCYNNTFGNYFQSNTFGNNCGRNTFGNDCTSNTFGNECYGNTFGNNVIWMKFLKDYTRYVIVENGNNFITLTSNKTTSSSAYLQNVMFALGANNVDQESGRRVISHNSVNDTFKTTYQSEDSTTVNVEDI